MDPNYLILGLADYLEYAETNDVSEDEVRRFISGLMIIITPSLTAGHTIKDADKIVSAMDRLIKLTRLTKPWPATAQMIREPDSESDDDKLPPVRDSDGNILLSPRSSHDKISAEWARESNLESDEEDLGKALLSLAVPSSSSAF